ncbi:MAG: NAD(P)H-dependent oxidoreductase subunit E [Planctomycetota bacterium]
MNLTVTVDVEEVRRILDQTAGAPGGVIASLEAVQDRYGYLPETAIRIVAERTGRALSDVYGVATFYKAFRLKPRGKHLLTVCLGTACHVRGGPRVAEAFARQLNVRAGETTADGEFSLETVNCLGACALGPVVVVDGRYYPKVSPGKVAGLLKQIREGRDPDVVDVADRRIFPVEASCARCNHSLMDPEHRVDGHPSIRVTVSCVGRHGWIRLSALYGSYTIESEHPIPQDALVQLFCPHCHTEFIGASACAECGAAMIVIKVGSKGVVYVCSRRGCKGHRLDVGLRVASRSDGGAPVPKGAS